MKRGQEGQIDTTHSYSSPWVHGESFRFIRSFPLNHPPHHACIHHPYAPPFLTQASRSRSPAARRVFTEKPEEIAKQLEIVPSMMVTVMSLPPFPSTYMTPPS